ncbi:MAG: M24 family metallopeptidase, partial [Anaerolineae bacterium]
FVIRSSPWHTPAAALADLTASMRLGADAPHAGAADLSDAFNRLRVRLTPAEGERFRALGRACARAMDAAIRSVRPGMTEYEIAGLLGEHTYAQGATPIVNLIATDERVFRFRHPLPTDRRLEKYAMLVLCGRRGGLVASITRLVHFGPLSDELRRKQEACARVDAVFIGRTRPGARVADILQAGVEVYAAAGYGDEWQLHHQGGAAGYQAREYLATPTANEVVYEGQAFAWNPSIAGVKSEDTILVGPETNEVLTAIPGWPMLAAEVNGRVWERPAILEVR